MRPLRVAALTSGRDVPSSRFRVRQQIPVLASHGVDVREHTPLVDKYRSVPLSLPPSLVRVAAALLGAAKVASRAPGLSGSWRADLTWIERELVPGRRTLERFARRPRVFDVDDAIWLTSARAARDIARIGREADAVIAGNRFIASWFSEVNERVFVVPTAVDTGRYRPADVPRAGATLTIGWIGTSSNFASLLEIEDALAEVVRAGTVTLLVVADAPPPFTRVPPEALEFQRWSAQSEVAAIQRMDVGIMPLRDDDWSRGKCAMKMLQYMACGVPAVVSAVGVSGEIAAAGGGVSARDGAEWVAALARLGSDRDARLTLGAAGRAIVEQRFSHRIVAAQLAEIFHELARGRRRP